MGSGLQLPNGSRLISSVSWSTTLAAPAKPRRGAANRTIWWTYVSRLGAMWPTKTRSVSNVRIRAEEIFGRIDVVVNNAGIMLLSAIADTTDADFDRQLAVNLKGTFNLFREAASRVRPGGRIISLSSSVVGLLQPTYGMMRPARQASRR